MTGGRVITVLALVLTGTALTSPAALAHVSLVGSEPGDGTSVTNVPRQVALRFNEPLSARFRQVRLIDRRGRVVPGTQVTGTGDGRRLTLSLPEGLPRGTYEVLWEALSENDGHVTGGALVFGAGVPVGPAVRPPPATAANTLDAVLRWTWLALVLALTGIVAVTAMLRRTAVPRVGEGAQRRLIRLVAPAAAGAAAVGLALLVREAALAPGEAHLGSAMARLLEERRGLLWASGEVLLLLLVALGAGLRHGTRLRGGLGACAALLVGVAASHVGAGHAAAVDPDVMILAGTVHLLAAGVWLGGVTALAIVLWPLRGSRAADVVRAVRGPFALLAGGALAIAVLTGLPAMGVQVASVDALLRTDYGQSMIAKGALMTLAGLAGLANAVALLRVHGDAPGRIARLVAIEAALGLGAVLAVAEMTASAPPRGPEFAAPRPVRAPVLAAPADDLLVSATARPNRVGTNVITVTTASTQRGYGPPVRGVTVRLAPRVAGSGAAARTVTLAPVGGGRWTGSAVLESAGTWQMTFAVRRPGARTTGRLTWPVEPADRVLPVRYSARRIAPIADRLVLGLLALLAAGGVAAVLARLRPARSRPAGGELQRARRTPA